jgi:putative spermidine/putrescine transport system permease protein
MPITLKKAINPKIAVAVFSLAVTLPLAWLIVQSFARNWRFPALFPPESSWRAWSYLLDSSSGISTALLNSLLIALLVTVLAICLALPAARGIALHNFKGKNLVLFLLLLPILSPAIAMAIGGHALFLRYGLTDSYLSVILAHLIPTVPYCVLTLTGSFLRFDVNLEAQARTLGASVWQVLWFVTLPSIAPSIGVSAVFAFLISWSQYLTTWLIGGGKIVTLPIVLVGFQRSSDEAVTAALTLIFLIPTIIFAALTTRFWREN